MLYTPLLLEHNYKTKHVKPLNVTFAVSDPDEVRYFRYGLINIRLLQVKDRLVVFS